MGWNISSSVIDAFEKAKTDTSQVDYTLGFAPHQTPSLPQSPQPAYSNPAPSSGNASADLLSGLNSGQLQSQGSVIPEPRYQFTIPEGVSTAEAVSPYPSPTQIPAFPSDPIQFTQQVFEQPKELTLQDKIGEVLKNAGLSTPAFPNTVDYTLGQQQHQDPYSNDYTRLFPEFEIPAPQSSQEFAEQSRAGFIGNQSFGDAAKSFYSVDPFLEPFGTSASELSQKVPGFDVVKPVLNAATLLPGNPLQAVGSTRLAIDKLTGKNIAPEVNSQDVAYNALQSLNLGNVAIAGAGPLVAPALRGAGPAGRLAGGIVEPMNNSGILGRLAAEAGVDFAAGTGSQVAGQIAQNAGISDPRLLMGASLLGGAVAGGTAAKVAGGFSPNAITPPASSVVPDDGPIRPRKNEYVQWGGEGRGTRDGYVVRIDDASGEVLVRHPVFREDITRVPIDQIQTPHRPVVDSGFRSSVLNAQSRVDTPSRITADVPEPPKPPTRTNVPTGDVPNEAPLGRANLAANLKATDETLSRPGPIGRLVGKVPGAKKVASIINPAANQERSITVANDARFRSIAELETKFLGTRGQTVDRIEDAFGGVHHQSVDLPGYQGSFVYPVNKPVYRGPTENPVKFTLIDIIENPRDYLLNDAQLYSIKQLADRDIGNVNLVRGGYDTDVRLFQMPDQDSAWVTHINLRDQDNAIRESYTSQLRSGRTHATVRDRMLSEINSGIALNKRFIPETDLRTLVSKHDFSLAMAAGDTTWKQGVDGLTRRQVLEIENPDLVKMHDDLLNKITSTREKIRRAEIRENKFVRSADELDRVLDRVEPRLPDNPRQVAKLPAEMRRQRGRADDLSVRADDAVPEFKGNVRQAERVAFRKAEEVARLEGRADVAEEIAAAAERSKTIKVPVKNRPGRIHEIIKNAQAKQRTLEQTAERALTPARQRQLTQARIELDSAMARLAGTQRQVAKVAKGQIKEAGLSGESRGINRVVDAFDSLDGDEAVKLRTIDTVINNSRARVADLGRQANVGRADNLQTELRNLQAQWNEFRPRWENAQIRDYQIPNGMFKYVPNDQASTVAAFAKETRESLDVALDATDTVRATVLAGDFSPITIQGSLNVIRSPISSAKAIYRMASGGGARATIERIAREEPEWAELYARSGSRTLGQTTNEFAASNSLLAKIPKFGTRYKATEESLIDFIQVMDYTTWKSRTEWLMSVDPKLSREVAGFEARNALSKSVPLLSGSQRGVTPRRGRYERGLLTSGSFLASPVLIAKDATSGLAKLVARQPLRGRERIALRDAFTMAATTMGISTALVALTAEDRGLTPEEAVRRLFTPGRKEFMSAPIPGTSKSVPLGGPFRSFIMGISPRYYSGEWHPPDLMQFARSKIAPLPSLALIDLPLDQDFYGNSVRNEGIGSKLTNLPLLEQALNVAFYTGESISPISGGAVAEGVRLDKPAGDIIEDAGTQLLGTNIQNEGRAQAQQRLARERGYDSYEAIIDDRVRKEINAELADSPYYGPQNELGEAIERNDALKLETEASLKEIDAEYAPNGEFTSIESAEAWREDRRKILDNSRARRDEVFQGLENDSEAVTVLEQYYDFIDQHTTRSTGDLLEKVDWDAVEAYLAGLDSTPKEIIAELTGVGRTPLEKEYYAAVDKIAGTGYWDVKDKVAEKIVGLSYADAKEQVQQLVRQKVLEQRPDLEGTDLNIVVASIVDKAMAPIDDATSDVRKKMRAADESLNQLLLEWGYKVPNQEDVRQALQ